MKHRLWRLNTTQIVTPLTHKITKNYLHGARVGTEATEDDVPAAHVLKQVLEYNVQEHILVSVIEHILYSLGIYQGQGCDVTTYDMCVN